MSTQKRYVSLFSLVLAAFVTAVTVGCPSPGATCADFPNMAAAIVGTWELHQGGTITFNANGSFVTSESTEGTYQIVGCSIVLDIASIPGDLNQVWTYLGKLPDGRLLFSQETPLGLARVNSQ